MPVFNNILAGSSGQGDTGYDIDQSLRFNEADSPKLSRTLGTATNRKIWSFSCWFKFGGVSAGNAKCFFAGYDNDNFIRVDSSQRLQIYAYQGGTDYGWISQPLLRDPSAWYHVLFVTDTTDASASQRQRIYLNGEQLTSRATDYGDPPADYEGYINDAVEHQVGTNFAGNEYWDGYLAEVNFIDGQALTPASFGETNSATNQWQAVEYSGSYGTNGFYEKFSSTELANSFTDDHVLSTQTAFTPSETLTCDILLVGGGGSGGNGQGGGGGAGQVRAIAGQSMSATSHAVTVAYGGNNSDAIFSIGTNGGITSLGSLPTAIGGGGGGSYSGNSGLDGASGGGGGGREGNGVNNVPGGTGSAGNDGGHGTMRQGGVYGGNGGGGGAGGAGSNGVQQGVGGAGGIGVTNDYRTGSAVYYGGGGGGADYSANAGGAGGQGGGGRGPTSGGGTDNLPGTANTGGGGGAGAIVKGEAGGSGIVVVRYQSNTQKATGGTVTTYGSGASQYYVHSFTDVAHTITANGDVTNTRAQYKVGDSSIKFDGTGDFLTAPSSDDWGFGTGEFTLEMWIRFANKKTGAGAAGANALLANHNSPNGWQWIWRGSDNTFELWATDQSEYASSFTLNNDTWYHVAVTRDVNTLRHYVDGVQCGSNAFTETMSDTSTTLQIGAYDASGLGLIDGYMDEIRISNTCRYPDGTTFTPSTTAFTADVNTKLLIHSDFNGGLGADSSGNKNDFTPTNLVATDQVLDSPTNNFATLNPLVPKANASSTFPTLSEGNLKWSGANASYYSRLLGTIPMTSGKWYWEVYNKEITSVGWTEGRVGIFSMKSLEEFGTSTTASHDITGTLLYSATNGKLQAGNGTGTPDDLATLSTYTNGDIIGIAVDMDASTILLYKNGSVQNSGTAIAFSAMSQPNGIADGALPWFNAIYSQHSRIVNFGQDSSFAGEKTAQGNGGVGEDFYYTPPTGYKALNTNNLDDPAIALPTAHFNTNLWTGNGSTGQSINVGFQPDLLIAKERTTATYVSARNSVTGVTKSLFTGLTNAEYTETNGVTAFTSTGFNLSGDGYGYVNRNTYTYVGWNWKAGGTASSNGNGSITSSVSANPTAGFSIVSYTGQSAAGTIGHGLSQAPEMIILKNRDQGVFWAGYVEALGNTKSISINDTGAAYTEKTWNDTSPTSTVFSIGAQSETSSGRFNVAGEDFIAYCFSSIEGYSKIGTYAGNNSTDGTFVYLGFTPAFILLKTYDNTDNWNIYDIKRNGYNGTGGTYQIRADTNQAGFSAAATMIDLVSNGVKMRTNDPGTNSARNYLYMAFAESPFKTSNAR